MRRHILMIEDEPAIASALGVRLGAAGFRTTSAENGLTGLAFAQREQPDAILLDIRLPDIDGFEVCERLKADTQLSDIPVVFLSANIQDQARERAYDAGAAAYLSKPYNPVQLIDTLNRVTNEDETERQQ